MARSVLRAHWLVPGYEVARQWPEGWFELLELLAAPVQRTSGLRNFNAEWPHLMAKIRAVRDAADRQRLEAATQAFVLASRRSQLPIVGRNVAPAPTLRSLAAEAGIGLRQLNSALAKGRTTTSDGRSRRRRVVALPQGVLHEQVQRQQSISRAAAARALGLSPARVDHLVGEVLRSTPPWASCLDLSRRRINRIGGLDKASAAAFPTRGARIAA
jgi:hypothetical protein